MGAGANIISYVRHDCKESFSERAPGSADSLVFSQLSYNKFNGFVANSPRFELTLRQLMDMDGLDSLFETTRVPEENRALLYAAADSPRFRDVRIGFYRSDLDDREEKQFSAVCFRLYEGLYYAAFRGTDASIVGWKEDLNMAFCPVVPSQLEAVEYLRELTDALPDARFILGGHSKGGNLAEYAATYAGKQAQARILAIYNHDGPGFRGDGIDLDLFAGIKPLIHKTVPESSVIGLLLEQHAGYRVIQSRGFLYLQHDPFSWLIKDGDFIYTPRVSDFSLRANAAISRWLAETDEETRQVFIEALYEASAPAREEEGAELRHMGIIKNMPVVISGIKTENPDIRRTVTDTLNLLVDAIAIEIKSAMTQRTERIISRGRRFFPGNQ